MIPVGPSHQADTSDIANGETAETAFHQNELAPELIVIGATSAWDTQVDGVLLLEVLVRSGGWVQALVLELVAQVPENLNIEVLIGVGPDHQVRHTQGIGRASAALEEPGALETEELFAPAVLM